MLVCILHSVTHLAEKAEATFDGKCLRIAITVYGAALDEFHHQIRQPFSGAASIEKPYDVRVIQSSQGLAFIAKTIENLIAF
jgi:hypothetical protein